MAPEDLADRLRSTTQRLVRRLNAPPRGLQGGPASHGQLSPLHRATLAHLDVTPGMTGAAIARAENVSSQAVNAVVRMLLQEHLVTSTRDPLDHRRRLLALTDEGRRVIRGIRQQKNSWLAQQFATLNPTEHQTLVEAEHILRRLLDGA